MKTVTIHGLDTYGRIKGVYIYTWSAKPAAYLGERITLITDTKRRNGDFLRWCCVWRWSLKSEWPHRQHWRCMRDDLLSIATSSGLYKCRSSSHTVRQSPWSTNTFALATFSHVFAISTSIVHANHRRDLVFVCLFVSSAWDSRFTMRISLALTRNFNPFGW